MYLRIHIFAERGSFKSLLSRIIKLNFTLYTRIRTNFGSKNKYATYTLHPTDRQWSKRCVGRVLHHGSQFWTNSWHCSWRLPSDLRSALDLAMFLFCQIYKSIRYLSRYVLKKEYSIGSCCSQIIHVQLGSFVTSQTLHSSNRPYIQLNKNTKCDDSGSDVFPCIKPNILPFLYKCKIQKNWCTVTVAPTIEHHDGHSRTPANQRWGHVPGRSHILKLF